MPETKQVLLPEPIFPAARKIDSIQYFGGNPLDPVSGTLVKRHGTANVESSIIGKSKDNDGAAIRHLSVKLSVSSDDDPDFYSLSISASGLYKATENMPEDKLDELVLTVGFSDLYSYVRDRVSIIMQGGVYGEVELPVLSAKMHK